MIEKLKLKSAATRLLEEQLYEQVVEELSKGQKRDGLWAKALANSEGRQEKAKALYIQYRVQSIKDEMEISEAVAKEAKKQLQNTAELPRKEALKILSDRGYHAKLMSFGWKVIQPQGGWLEFSSTAELIDFAKSVEPYKTIR